MNGVLPQAMILTLGLHIGENQSSGFLFFLSPDAPSMQVKTPDSWQQLQRKEG